MAFSKFAVLALLALQTITASGYLETSFSLEKEAIENDEETTAEVEIENHYSHAIMIQTIGGNITCGSVSHPLAVYLDVSRVETRQMAHLKYPVRALFSIPDEIPSLPATALLKVEAIIKHTTTGQDTSISICNKEISIVADLGAI